VASARVARRSERGKYSRLPRPSSGSAQSRLHTREQSDTVSKRISRPEERLSPLHLPCPPSPQSPELAGHLPVSPVHPRPAHGQAETRWTRHSRTRSDSHCNLRAAILLSSSVSEPASCVVRAVVRCAAFEPRSPSPSSCCGGTREVRPKRAEAPFHQVSPSSSRVPSFTPSTI
jgi:hypothetical protein